MKPLAAALFCLLLVSCAPATEDARAEVVVLGAPSELRSPGLADAFTSVLKRHIGSEVGFVPAATLRFQESHRDMSGANAPRQAAAIARLHSAPYAVMVGLVGEKSARVVSAGGGVAEIEVRLSGHLQATLVDAGLKGENPGTPDNTTTLGTYTSSAFSVRTVERATYTLPGGVELDSAEGRTVLRNLAEKVRRDASPNYRRGFDGSLRDLAAPVAAELNRLLTSGL